MALNQYRFELKVTGYVKTEHFSMARIEREIEKALADLGIQEVFLTNVSFGGIGDRPNGNINRS